MTLDPLTPRPSDRCYVLKLDRSARPQPDGLSGRLENIATGSHVAFDGGDQLLLALASDLATHAVAPKEDPHEP